MLDIFAFFVKIVYYYWGDKMDLKLMYLISYVVIINITGVITMKIDKKRAIKNKYRISEKNLFIIALLLGGVGIYLGMQIFHHKTKHAKFIIGIPITISLNIISIYYIILHVIK